MTYVIIASIWLQLITFMAISLKDLLRKRIASFQGTCSSVLSCHLPNLSSFLHPSLHTPATCPYLSCSSSLFFFPLTERETDLMWQDGRKCWTPLIRLTKTTSTKELVNPGYTNTDTPTQKSKRKKDPNIHEYPLLCSRQDP